MTHAARQLKIPADLCERMKLRNSKACEVAQGDGLGINGHRLLSSSFHLVSCRRLNVPMDLAARMKQKAEGKGVRLPDFDR